jgi:pantetheine-phosphate adenylyltransferase
MKRVAVYPGTFDPVTNGHLDLVDRANRHFDQVVVSVLRNANKQPLFSMEERVAFLKQAVADRDGVSVDAFDGLLVDHCRQIGATVILRGLRAISDFEYEMQAAMMNRKLNPDIETIFLLPGEAYSYLSSNLVREIGRLGGDISQLVPAHVSEAMKSRFQ